MRGEEEKRVKRWMEKECEAGEKGVRGGEGSECAWCVW